MLLDIARTNCSNVSQVEVELSEERPNCKHGSFAFSRPQHSKNQNSAMYKTRFDFSIIK